MPETDLDAAIDSLARVKDEHRVILAQIAHDPGMAPETRASLIAHLYEEEDEHVAELRALRGAAPASAVPSGSGGLTVGSLRAEPAASARAGGGLSVGSLRHD